jgi:hypothetical protein
MMKNTQNTQKFVMNAGLFGAIGTLWAGTPSSISPFQYGTKTAPGNEEKQALANAGICDTNGQILPAARPVLEVLGTARAFTRMYLSGNLSPSECIVYFSPDGSAVSLMNTGSGMEIVFPAAAEVFVEMAAEGIGSSVYRSVPFDAILSHDECVVLAEMLDIQRKQVMRSIADEKEPAVAESDISDLRQICSRKGENTQWLINVIMEILSVEGISSEDRVRVAVESLVRKGYAMNNQASYRLSDVTLALARRLLIFDTALTLTSGSIGKSGVVKVAGFTCLGAGVHDLLIIDAAVDSVTLQSVSGAAVIDNVRSYLTDVRLLEKLDTPSGGTETQTRKFCPQCGTAIQPGRKFCGSCGVKL